MYQAFFGLRERPFDLTPNPRFLYLTARHREALGNLQYGIGGRKGITLLVGEAGTGKTTLVRAAIDAISGPGVRCVYVSNPALTRAEFYEFLAPKFGLSERAAGSKARFLVELEQSLTERLESHGTTALIIDEAQSMPRELMEEVRLLANFETATEKLLPVVLAGQPELAELLEHESLRQLKQRVALRCDLSPFDIRETAAYIAGRIAIAGGDSAKVFTREAVQTIFDRSRGIPRTISVICDNSLVTGFAGGVKPVGSDIVTEVCRDFNLAGVKPAGGNGNGPGRGLAVGIGITAAGREGLASPGASREAAAARPPAAHPGAAASGRPGVAAGGRSAAPATGPVAAAPRLAAPRAQAAPASAGAAPSSDGGLFSLFTKRKRFRFF